MSSSRGHGTIASGLKYGLRSPVAVSFVVCLLSISGVTLATGGSHPSNSGGTGRGTPLTPAGCPSPGIASLAVPLGPPGFSLSKGDSLTVTYEFRVQATNLSLIDVRVNAPSLFGQFPTTANGSLQYYFAPRSFHLTSTAWTSPALASATKVMTGPTKFSSATAQMTSELLGVMSTAPQGTMELAFRWAWSVSFASNGTTTTSPWSGLTPNVSVFFPAPYVAVVSSSNTTIAIGSTFTANLRGAISQTKFTSELEFGSNGLVIRATLTTTPKGNLTPAPVGVQILPGPSHPQPLAPAKMLDHIRNNCGQLLYSISLTTVYAKAATVLFGVSPASCGPLTFNGTSHANGSKAVVTPSSVSYPIVAGNCPGHVFSGWSLTPGVYTAGPSTSSTKIVVSASGTLTAQYR